AVALQVAVEAEVPEDVEGVIDVFEGAAELVAAVAPFGEMLGENLPALLGIHPGGDLPELRERLARAGVKNPGNRLFFGGAVVIDQGYGFLRLERPEVCDLRRERPGGGWSPGQIFVELGALPEGRNLLVEIAVHG